MATDDDIIQHTADLHQHIQAHARAACELEPGTALVTWIVAAGWVNPDGTYVTTKMSGTTSGAEPPCWESDGLAAYALLDRDRTPLEDDDPDA